jgi:C4-dicarboxylate-specific signal transduction histidine kinase
MDLNELVTRTVEFVRPQNRFDGVTMDVDLDPGLPPVVLDGGRIQQVLINLLANAADALKEAGVTKPRIQVRTSRVDGAVGIRVTDNGPGIPEENLTRVFEPHFTTKATGHGFGLATSFKIVASHGGRIEAENRQEGGAEFSIQLPRAA